MRVALVHHTLASLGGGERVFTYLVKALNNAGIIPDVYSLNPVEPKRLAEYYGIEVEYRLRGVRRLPSLPVFGIYQRFLASYLSARLSGYDVVVNTTGVYSPVSYDRKSVSRYVLYVYNPFITVVKGVKQGNDIGGLDKYEGSVFWKLYFKPYTWLVKRSVNLLRDSRAIVVSVSEFTRLRVRKYWGIDSVTVYPPVDVEKFIEVYDNTKRDGVISIGRFTPEKRHLEQLEVAKRLPHITFRICGGANTPYYRRWFEHVKARAEEMGLKNVEFYPNISFQKLVELVGESRIFIHTMVNEDFGLATAESISGGVLPVVHNSGGQIEIVPYRSLRFNSTEEAVRMVDYWHRHYDKSIVAKLYRHIQRFKAENFMKAMLKVLGIKS